MNRKSRLLQLLLSKLNNGISFCHLVTQDEGIDQLKKTLLYFLYFVFDLIIAFCNSLVVTLTSPAV